MQRVKPQTAEQIWNWAALILNGDGVAMRSAHQVRARSHLLVEHDRMWCSGGHRVVKCSNPLGRYCPTCLSLARDMLEELWEDDDADVSPTPVADQPTDPTNGSVVAERT